MFACGGGRQRFVDWAATGSSMTSATGSLRSSGVTSRTTTWALVPPTPSELTPARRGRIASGQSASRSAYCDVGDGSESLHCTPGEYRAVTEDMATGARSMLVKRLKPLPIEAVVRGYLAGSG